MKRIEPIEFGLKLRRIWSFIYHIEIPPDPSLQEMLRKREMRIENRINLFRFPLVFFFFGNMLFLRLGIIPSLGMTIHFSWLVLVALLMLGGLFDLHRRTRSGIYLKEMKYISQVIDLLIVVAITYLFTHVFQFPPSINFSANPLFNTIIVIFYNIITMFRASPLAVVFGTIAGALANLFMFVIVDGSMNLLFFSTLIILTLGIFNLWGCRFILENLISNFLLGIKNQELSQTLATLKKTQSQLIESEKMATIGSLVAGVSHELNTPLGIGITAATDLQSSLLTIQESISNQHMTKRQLEDFLGITAESTTLITRQLQRAAELIKSFKEISVDQITDQARTFNLCEYLEEIAVSIRPKMKGRPLSIHIVCSKDIIIQSYPGLLAQILTNLLLNSLLHAFAPSSSGRMTIAAEITPERWLKLDYHDDGAGIPEALLPKIFDPFFTTNVQEGTGLGLNIVQSIVVQKLKGRITCQSVLGQGTHFEIVFPVETA